MNGRRARANRREAEIETAIAIRAYTPRTRRSCPQHALPEPELILVFDTETRTDHAQALLCGSYRVYTAAGTLRQEGLIAADDLSEAELAILREYVATHAAEDGRPLRLMGRSEFVRAVLWPIGYVARALIVGFNLPFDLSRLAWGWRPARNGGFTLQLWESVDADGRLWPDLYRPEITIKALDSKRQFTRFTTPARLDPELRMEDGSPSKGRFLDLHTLVYAFTDKSRSLNAAARTFLGKRKGAVAEHGVLTPEYIDYNRQDVRLPWELYRVLVAEWRRHPIDLSPEQAYSPAAVSKAYLRAMGVVPPCERRLTLDDERLGQAMTAYFGGRTETRIRRVPLPVRVVDFTSMYPTVFALLGALGVDHRRRVRGDGRDRRRPGDPCRSEPRRAPRPRALAPPRGRVLSGPASGRAAARPGPLRHGRDSRIGIGGLDDRAQRARRRARPLVHARRRRRRGAPRRQGAHDP